MIERFFIMNKPTLNLCSEIVLNRNSACGKTTCVIEELRFNSEKRLILSKVFLNEFMGKLGFLGAPDYEISFDQAKEIIRDILHKDLAHKVEISRPDYAETQAINFLDYFGENAKFFTNQNVVEKDRKPFSWFPLSSSTFDTGIVCFDEKRIGVLWVEDED